MSTLMNATECNECVTLFKEGKTAKELAVMYKRHPRTIEKLMKRRGVTKRLPPISTVADAPEAYSE